MAVHRDMYEGTPYDMTKVALVRDRVRVRARARVRVRAMVRVRHIPNPYP